ncbi:hypothetical protein TNCV_3274221 [Trichonephila clavipes]|nr:hypothetical protein TNCV_3274221 [Trichonephila clavipes]
MGDNMTALPITGQQPTAAAAAAFGTRVAAMGPTSVGAARPTGIAVANIHQGQPAACSYTCHMRNPLQPQTVQQAITQQHFLYSSCTIATWFSVLYDMLDLKRRRLVSNFVAKQLEVSTNCV